MSGVFGSMRRTLLSCTSLARNGTIALGSSMLALLATTTSSHAADISLLDGIRGLNHQEFAVLTTALALLGFTVVSAILLMHTRVRAAKLEAALRSNIRDL
jgi:hypothetical protein